MAVGSGHCASVSIRTRRLMMQKSDITPMPISLREANTFVLHFHRHNKPTQGGKFAIGCLYEDKMVGVAIVGRPVARLMDDGWTAEVTRLCVIPSAPKNVCSFLYARCWRIWQQMGGTRMLTYTLQTESGASLKGAGWKIIGKTKPQSWSREERRREWQDIYDQPKLRWEAGRAKI